MQIIFIYIPIQIFIWLEIIRSVERIKKQIGICIHINKYFEEIHIKYVWL